MISYIVNSGLCAALLLLVYKVFLEKEKIHLFKRYFLIFCIVFSLVVPFVQLPVYQKSHMILNESILHQEWIPAYQPENPVPDKELQNFKTETENSIAIAGKYSLYDYIFHFYFIVFAVLIIRFLYQLYFLYHKKRKYPGLPYRGAKLVLTNEPVAPYAFWNWIFIHQNDWHKGKINEEILQHECIHIRQKHSADIILIELASIVFWFNPIFRLYKKSIQLNHEFLADEAVIKSFDIQKYQKLILKSIKKYQYSTIATHFNYSTTKSRMIMMYRKNSPFKIALIKAITVPVFIAFLFIFCDKSLAQHKDNPNDPQSNYKIVWVDQHQIDRKEWNEKRSNFKVQEVDVHQITIKEESTIKLNPNDVPQSNNGQDQSNLVKEYEALVNKARHPDKEEIWVNKLDIPRLQKLYEAMDETQRNQVTKVLYVPAQIPPSRKFPTPSQLAEWQSSEFGVWVDGKKIANTDLTFYNADDFSLYFQSKLEKNAKEYGKHFHQVNLYTHQHYEEVWLTSTRGGLYDLKPVYKAESEKYHQKSKEYSNGNKINMEEVKAMYTLVNRIYNAFSEEEKEKYNILPPPPVIEKGN